MFTALGLARKTHREFEVAVELDEKNYSARQALIEFDCSAPAIVGGGEEKAKPEIEKLKAMDASEWHYAEGNCRRQKKDFTTADAEFQLALESHPNRADLLFDIGDYAMRHGQAERLIEVGGSWGANGTCGPARNVLSSSGVDPQERETRRGRATLAGISAESAKTIVLSALCDCARMAGATL